MPSRLAPVASDHWEWYEMIWNYMKLYQIIWNYMKSSDLGITRFPFPLSSSRIHQSQRKLRCPAAMASMHGTWQEPVAPGGAPKFMSSWEFYMVCYSLLDGFQWDSTMERFTISGWWWLEHDFHFFHLLGMSSSQLTSIFIRGVGIPPTRYGMLWSFRIL